ncbi:hypothetical protein DPMN_039012 [Dreissena polymorpha]|uniref:Uncharacterized protein n=1 Tax=Dreissena polymorpha TaxID=45954 RepID=A0A9D4MGF1_DREPO|nr:hypothetical protein DPMN_039012 [Dreissena polymorpha]
MRLTHGMYEAEEIMNTSTIGQASLSLSDKGPYRHVRIQANQENETLTLCEIQIKGNPQPRTPRK